MMDNHLNFFAPYERAAAWHENQLTRALLVVLRYSPMAHQLWLRLVDPDLKLHDLSKAKFATQRQRIIADDADVPEGESIPGISVWLAPDAAQVITPVTASDRQQILDGIVTYGNDLVVVIENKIAWGEVTQQPHRLNLHGSPIIFENEPRSVTWQELLAGLADLIERDLVFGAESLILSDFLDLVEENFPNIGPSSTLARCGNHRFRIERRLDAVQGEVIGADEGKDLGWRDLKVTPKIAMAWLGLSEDNSTVCLHMYPGDTLSQARALYGDVAAVEEVLALKNDDWGVEPNFHWGFMAPGYAWTKTPLSVEKYCAYWVEQIVSTWELDRPNWAPYLAKLESDQIIDSSGIEKFDAEFTSKQRQKAHPRPGLFCEFTWSLAEATRLDARGKLVEAVRQRINQMLAALQAPTLADTFPTDGNVAKKRGLVGHTSESATTQSEHDNASKI